MHTCDKRSVGWSAAEIKRRREEASGAWCERKSTKACRLKVKIAGKVLYILWQRSYKR